MEQEDNMDQTAGQQQLSLSNEGKETRFQFNFPSAPIAAGLQIWPVLYTKCPRSSSYTHQTQATEIWANLRQTILQSRIRAVLIGAGVILRGHLSIDLGYKYRHQQDTCSNHFFEWIKIRHHSVYE